MNKLTFVLMATMMLMFSFSATTSASGNSIQELYLGQLWLNGAEMAVSGNVAIPSSQAYGPNGTAEIAVLLWKQNSDGNWYVIQGENRLITANGQSQAFSLSDLRYDPRQPNLWSGVYKVSFIAPPGSTWSNLNAWTWYN
ncbi:hypothetical protein ACFQZE_04330 [Paenibacillus sp. GCM10027627]